MEAQIVIWMAVLGALAGLVFSSLHLALTDLSPSGLESILDRNQASAEVRSRIERILNDLPGHARAVALPRLVCSLTVAVCLVWWILLLRTGKAPVIPTESVVESVKVMGLAEALLAIGGASAVLWLNLVVLPASIASHAGERLVFGLSGLVRAVYIIESPIRPIARVLDGTVRALSGAKRQSEHQQLQADILSAVEESEREGAIDETSKDMIEAVVDLRNRTVEQIMTPRTEIVSLELTDNLEEIMAFVRRDGHSRVPVYERDLDHIVGVLYAKDLFQSVGPGASAQPFRLKERLRPAFFVPETKTVQELLSELLMRRVHIAIVADEFGGTSGIVTIEDIIEEVFGEISDEYESAHDAPPKIAIEAKGAVIEARAAIRDANDAMEVLGLAIPESNDYDTVAGYVMKSLGRVPDAGEYFIADGLRVLIEQAHPTRVVKVRVDPAPEVEPTDETRHGNGRLVISDPEPNPSVRPPIPAAARRSAKAG